MKCIFKDINSFIYLFGIYRCCLLVQKEECILTLIEKIGKVPRKKNRENPSHVPLECLQNEKWISLERRLLVGFTAQAANPDSSKWEWKTGWNSWLHIQQWRWDHWRFPLREGQRTIFSRRIFEARCPTPNEAWVGQLHATKNNTF